MRSILVPEAIRGIFFPNAQCTWKEFWEHSLICAQLCRQISGWIDYPCPEEAYLAGLLHNLGIFLLMSNDPARYQSVVVSAEEGVDIETAEEKAFGISHTKIGGIYAEKWKFPRPITLAVRHHHGIDENVSHSLINMVAVAIGLAQENGAGIEPTASGPRQYDTALNNLHLNRKKVASLLHRVPRPLLLAAKA
jgi:HD-like signal output (HDOD) protein